MSEVVRTADLFAGMGGIRLGFEQACAEFGLESECVFESEIKPHAVRVLKANHPNGEVFGDVTKIDASTIPDFDFLLAGFPCQAFSTAGLRRGFEDARGTLFFEAARILKEKSPYGFVLENVEGLVVHDRKNATDEIGSTLTTMLAILTELGYLWSWKVVDASTLGVPQRRRRLYLVGTKERKPNLEGLPRRESKVGDVLETGLPSSEIPFAKLLLSKFPSSFLAGKSVKDKRLGPNNLNAWDVESKGSLTDAEKRLMRSIATERRKKKWAKEYGIDWMDGMPLTESMIRSFADEPENVRGMLDDLTKKGYLSRKRPKRKTADGRRETDSRIRRGLGKAVVPDFDDSRPERNGPDADGDGHGQDVRSGRGRNQTDYAPRGTSAVRISRGLRLSGIGKGRVRPARKHRRRSCDTRGLETGSRRLERTGTKVSHMKVRNFHTETT